MKKRVLAMTLMTLVLASGCMIPSRGRVTVIKWDSRTAEQLTAAKYSDGVVFGAYGEVKEEASAKSVTLWTQILSFLGALKAKVSFVEIEWDSTGTILGKDGKPLLSVRPISVGEEKK